MARRRVDLRRVAEAIGDPTAAGWPWTLIAATVAYVEHLESLAVSVAAAARRAGHRGLADEVEDLIALGVRVEEGDAGIPPDRSAVAARIRQRLGEG